MRKATILVLVALLAIALVPAAAFAAGYDEPVSGVSPHAGWTTTSDQCKQCHAVHLATGNRLLLRSMDSRYNDCAYCHLDGSQGAGFDVFIGDLDNGHTMGSWTSKEATGGARPSRYNANGTVHIPDNSASGDARDYRGGSKAKAGTTNAYAGLDTEVPVSPGAGLRDNGDTTFNCNGCHMAHANPSKIITWRFESYNAAARTRDENGLYTYYGPDYARYKNFDGSYSDQNSRIVNTTRLTNKILVRNPNSRADGAAATYYSYVDGDARTSGDRSLALTQWCADCHNQNVKGPGMIAGQPVDYATAYTEQANIFSHSTAYNLSGVSKYLGYTTSQGGTGYTGIAPSCADCHVGYSDATTAHDVGGGDTEARVAENYGDWPHSGSSSSYALLNEMMVKSAPGDSAVSTTPMNNGGTDATSYDVAGLDGLCRSCHGGAATSTGRDPQDTIMPITSVPGTFEANSQ